MSAFETGGAGSTGPTGDAGAAGATGPTGEAGQYVSLLAANGATSGAFTNLTAGNVGAVADPNFRAMLDLRGITKIRIMGRHGGSIVAATKLRIQYHTGIDPAVASGDAGWTTLATSAGSHTLNVMYYTAEITVPAGAQINNCLIRAVLFDGDGAADPTITLCICNFYA